MVNGDEAAIRRQVARQVGHWRSATASLNDLDNFAAPSAWSALERYLGLAIRGQLADTSQRLRQNIEAIGLDLRHARTLEELERTRQRLVRFRKRFLRTETVFDFFGDAVNTRTSPRIAGLLAACDWLAVRSMREVLDPLGKQSPPVLSFVDRGLGAAIIRAGVRLWDGGSLNPVAAIKVVRHNLSRPAGSLFHESGHQVAHIVGWNDELARTLAGVLRDDASLSSTWQSWASEIAADTFAFAHTGYASVATLHDVLAGEEETVFSFLPGDPHPIAYVRVLLGVQMAAHSYGESGPWADLAAAWISAHPIASAPSDVRDLLSRSVPRLPEIADACLSAPMTGFGNRPLTALINPARVSPTALEQLEATAGRALTTSPFWLEREGVRIAALFGYRAAIAPERSADLSEGQEDWMLQLGRGIRAAAA